MLIVRNISRHTELPKIQPTCLLKNVTISLVFNIILLPEKSKYVLGRFMQDGELRRLPELFIRILRKSLSKQIP